MDTPLPRKKKHKGFCCVWAASGLRIVVWLLTETEFGNVSMLLGVQSAPPLPPSLPTPHCSSTRFFKFSTPPQSQCLPIPHVTPTPHLWSHNDRPCDARGKVAQPSTASAITVAIVSRLFLRISNTPENGGSCCASHSPHSGRQNKGEKAF